MQFSSIFQDHAVLQRNLSLPIWGFSGPSERVTVRLAGLTASVTSEPDGRWLVRLPKLSTGGPYQLSAESASGKAVLNDILVGDVWICSGQSNMEWQVHQTGVPENAQLLEELPQIRLLTVTNPASLGHRQERIDGQWVLADARTLLSFSAVGAWFGRDLHHELGVPIGLICNAWGGTRVQAWISREALFQDHEAQQEVVKYESGNYSPPGKTSYITFQDWELYESPKDPGIAVSSKGWNSIEFDHSSWPKMTVPSSWQENGHPGSGIFWFRYRFKIPAGWVGADLQIHLGSIDKHDDTWVNGEWVGGLSRKDGPNTWCTPRVYRVPCQLVGPDGSLDIAIRVCSHVFNGGLMGPKEEMYVAPFAMPDEAPVSLAGEWHYSVEQDWGVINPNLAYGLGNPNSPFILFDSRVAPLIPYGIFGVIWYQGESNAFEAQNYKRLLLLMIRDWRRKWGQNDFAFLQVQLANFSPGLGKWAELREAQLAVLAEPNTGMTVAIDIGEPRNIHPREKRVVGKRLAQWSLSQNYGRREIPSGPLYLRATYEALGLVRIYFRYARELKSRDGRPISYLTIAGHERKFIAAENRIEGETLVVWHPSISNPESVRYAWSDNPEGCNLINGDDLPASPFRTDTWKL